MRDANEEALNKHLEEVSRIEEITESFHESIDGHISDIEDILNEIYNIADGLEKESGYEFYDDVSDRLAEITK